MGGRRGLISFSFSPPPPQIPSLHHTVYLDNDSQECSKSLSVVYWKPLGETRLGEGSQRPRTGSPGLKGGPLSQWCSTAAHLGSSPCPSRSVSSLPHNCRVGILVPSYTLGNQQAPVVNQTDLPSSWPSADVAYYHTIGPAARLC